MSLLMKTEKLSSAFGEWIENNHLTWQEAADKLGQNANSLRAWTYRNHFPQQAVTTIARALGLPQDLSELQKKYDFKLTRSKNTPRESIDSLGEEPADLSDAFTMFDARLARFTPYSGEVGTDLRAVFERLGDGDVRVYWAIDREPWELTHEGVAALGRSMIEAGGRGATFVYLYPSRDVATLARRADFRRPLDKAEFSDLLSRFERLLEVECKGSTFKGLSQRFLAIECNVPGYMLPGFAVSLYRIRSSAVPAPSYRALAAIPCGIREQEITLQLCLGRTATDRFIGFVRAALCEAGKTALAAQV